MKTKAEKLYSKLWEAGTNIPAMSQHSNCCGMAHLGRFPSGDRTYVVRATEEEMQEYWKFVAELARRTGYSIITFSDWIKNKRHTRDVCGSNFYKFLKEHPEYGRVIESSITQSKGKRHKIQLYVWEPVDPRRSKLWASKKYKIRNQNYNSATGRYTPGPEKEITSLYVPEAVASTTVYNAIRGVRDHYPPIISYEFGYGVPVITKEDNLHDTDF